MSMFVTVHGRAWEVWHDADYDTWWARLENGADAVVGATLDRLLRALDLLGRES